VPPIQSGLAAKTKPENEQKKASKEQGCARANYL